MAAVTICSDCGPKKIKSDTISTVSPSISHEVMGPDAILTKYLTVLPSNPFFPLCVCAQSMSCVQLLATPWTVAHQAPLSMGFHRQDYWSRLIFPTTGDLHNPGMGPVSLEFHALAGRFFTTNTT